MERTNGVDTSERSAGSEPEARALEPVRRVRVSANNPTSVLRLLSTRNLELVRLIKARPPASVAELGRMSGRPKASLMLTLRRLERAGIIALHDGETGRKRPVVVCERVEVEIDLLD